MRLFIMILLLTPSKALADGVSGNSFICENFAGVIRGIIIKDEKLILLSPYALPDEANKYEELSFNYSIKPSEVLWGGFNAFGYDLHSLNRKTLVYQYSHKHMELEFNCEFSSVDAVYKKFEDNFLTKHKDNKF